MQKTVILLLVVCLILAACGNNAPESTPTLPAPTQVPTQTPVPTPEPTPTPSGPVIPQPPLNRTHYQLDLILNYYTHYGTVTESITYTNRSSQPMAEILLVVPPRNYYNAYQQYSLTGVRVDGFREEGLRTWVSLGTPLQPGEVTRVNLTYRLNFPEHQGIFGWTNRQLNISDWYPYIPPYDETSGWLAYEQVIDDTNTIVGEYIVNEVADFDVSIQLTDHADLIEIAASAPANSVDGKLTYHFELARAFAFSVSDSFFEHEIVHNGVRIRTSVFMNQQETGVLMAQLAAQALDLFNELFYPYPREMITIVTGDFLHNMEMDGMFMLSHKVVDFYDTTPKNNLTILLPHELSHQWFYSLVGNNAATEPWLDEALATYTEVLYYERYHPELVEWWWRNRVWEYDHSGMVNSDITIPGGYVNYRAAIYLNGATFLEELRQALGDKAFFAALQDYSMTNTYQIATRQSFFDAIARHSTVDLSGIIAKYFSN